MRSYFVNRIIQLVIVLFGASIMTFGLLYICPGDPAEQYYLSHNIVPSREALEQTREEMGLNRPFLVQYGMWVSNIVRGELGDSYSTKEDVLDVLRQKAPVTLKLASLASVFLILSAVILGTLSAVYNGSVVEFVIRCFSFISISVPVFWLGLILIYFFVLKVRIFKLTETTSMQGYILPALTLAIPLIGRFTRLVRAAVLDELSKDYVIGVKSRGLSRRKIIFNHVLPNSMIGIITVLGISIAWLLGGTVIVENIFSLVGLGTMVLEAIQNRDYPLIQSYVILMTVIYTFSSFFIDIIVQLLDPRVKVFGRNFSDE